MRAEPPFQLKESSPKRAHIPQDVPARRALITGSVMVGLCIAGLVAGLMGFEPWPAALGAMFLFSGIAELADSAYARETRHASRISLAGVLPSVLGIFLVFQMGLGPAAVVSSVAVFFLASGVTRAVVGAIDRYRRWGWDELYAVVVLVLAGGAFAFGGDVLGSRLWYFIAAEFLLRGLTMAGRDHAVWHELAQRGGPP